MQDRRLRWRRLFGIGLTDLFSRRPFGVEMDKGLAVKSRLLDIVIVRKSG